MLIVRVELLSAITGQTTELARMHICNDGSAASPRLGNYDVATMRGRGDGLDHNTVQRKGRVDNYRRLDLHVWNLVTLALKALRYGE